MKESDQQLEELKVPVAGGYLNQLIKERKDAVFFNQSKLLCDMAKEEDFIIMGRCAQTFNTSGL